MQKIIECIPNFSEGRNKKTIRAIVQTIVNIPGIMLLDQESDPAHNRSVITFAGEPEAVLEAAFQACKCAAELIDMDAHRGEHPRMGATDVIPLVPIKNVSEKEAVEFAKKLAERIGLQLQIPVYLYEKAATRPERKNLAEVRIGQYEGIKEEIGKNSQRDPDFGPKKLGKAGATAIGVREALVAFNVNLDSKDLKIAKAIARKIRERDGGLPYVKALGFELADRKIVQISMNLTNYKITPPHIAFRAIKKEAKKHNVKILESEVIGLIPNEALVAGAKHFLKLKNFKDEQILENVLQEKVIPGDNSNANTFNQISFSPTILAFLDQMASKSPTPGGGSASALSGALAAALISMIANLTLNSKKYESVHPEMKKLLANSEKLRQKLYELIEEDAESYNKVIQAYRSKDSNQIEKSLKEAANTPLETAKTAIQLLELIKIAAAKGNKNAASDCGVAAYLTQTAVKGAILNIQINLKSIKDKTFIRKITGEYQKIQKILKTF